MESIRGKFSSNFHVYLVNRKTLHRWKIVNSMPNRKISSIKMSDDENVNMKKIERAKRF